MQESTEALQQQNFSNHPWYGIDFECAGSSFRLQIPEHLLEEMMDGLVPISEFVYLPESIRLTALRIGFQKLAGRFLANIPESMKLQGVYSLDENTKSFDHSLSFDVKIGEVSHQMVLEFDGGVSEFVLKLIEELDGQVDARLGESVTVGLNWGSLNLDPSALESLKVGDALLMPQSFVDEGFTLTVDGRGLMKGVFDVEGQAELVGSLEKSEASQDLHVVQMDFELASTSVAKGDLLTMAAGSRLDIPPLVDRKILTIKSEGKERGVGQIVEVGGRLGVQILTTSIEG